MFMYNGYSSYESEIRRHIQCNSPLSFNTPLDVAENTVKPCLTYIMDSIKTNQPLRISTDKDFKWYLEFFSFGFTCEDSSIYKLCANIYVEWLKVFEDTSFNSPTIPPILREKSEFYWSQMFWHLYHLFVIHDEKSADLAAKNMYTHKILRQLQIMIGQTELTVNLWHTILQVLLAIGDAVLSSPYRTNDEHCAIMSHRLVPSIYQVFLVAVDKVNIPPGLWKTFRDYAVIWRHRPAVIYDWAILTCILTSTVVRKLWWSDLILLQYNCTETDQSDHVQKTIDSYPLDVLVTTWFRFLTILQNPSECGDISIFLDMPKYVEFRKQYPSTKIRELKSLLELPHIFVNVTKAIQMFIDIWLGKNIDLNKLHGPNVLNNLSATSNDNTLASRIRLSVNQSSSQQQQQQQQSSAMTTRQIVENRRANLKQTASVPGPTPSTQNYSQDIQTFVRMNRPTVNSLLNLYGPWIFDACLLQLKDRHLHADSNRLNEIERILDIQHERFIEEGLATSFANLCTIFSSAQCDEYIHPEYLSRFYYILQQGLRFYQGDEHLSLSIIEAILLNSSDLFRINLRGINILVPLYLNSIEYYLKLDLQNYMNANSNAKHATDASVIRERFIHIRSKCIQILMSIISLPYYYEHLQLPLFEDYFEKSNDVQPIIKLFSQYRLKIRPLLLDALRTEDDVTNKQLLFGTIRLACSLAAHYEQQLSEDKLYKDSITDYLNCALILICEKGTVNPHVCLAALDTIISIVTDPICQLSIDAWKRVLQSLCKFIDEQLQREKIHHTREMHSTCVATYNTLVTLIIERPTLLDDTENLFLLCETIELGISGQKAQSLENIAFKQNKGPPHPASQRVAEAAEYLMWVLFEHKSVNHLINVTNRSITGACLHAERNGDILNEEAVLHLKNDICRNGLDETSFENTLTPSHFKYFSVNENTLFAISELPNAVNNDMPGLILLCRGLFGKKVWTLNFRHNPMTNSGVTRNRSRERTLVEADRTFSVSTTSAIEQKERIPSTYTPRTERTNSELSIPTLNSVIKRDEERLNKLKLLKIKQIKFEENALQRSYFFDEKSSQKCKPPECQKYFESIRLFLSHYGYCSLDSMNRLLNDEQWDKTKVPNQLQPRIQLLESNSSIFMNDIKKLDKISPTLYCTGQIFYLKQNQTTLSESFLNTTTPEQLNPSFLTMISQFGSVVEVKRHCGWTGAIETSWKTVSAGQLNKVSSTKKLAEIDGYDSIIYWVDLTTEMAFYLPHQFPANIQNSDMRILIVWLERFIDNLDSILPVQEQQSKTRNISIIGIHPLKNRLYRISLNSNAQRMQSVCASIPLINGMVVPLHILPVFLRQAVNNLTRRKRLEDSQSSQTVYSVRKNLIKKLIEKYQNRANANVDEYFQNIFFSSSIRQQAIVTQMRPRINSMLNVQS